MVYPTLQAGNLFLQPHHSGFLVFFITPRAPSFPAVLQLTHPSERPPWGWGWSWTSRTDTARDLPPSAAGKGHYRAKKTSRRCCCATNTRGSALLCSPWHRYPPLEPGFRHRIHENEGKYKKINKNLWAKTSLPKSQFNSQALSIFKTRFYFYHKHKFFSRTWQQDQPSPARAAQAGKGFGIYARKDKSNPLGRGIPMAAAGWAVLRGPWGAPSLLVPCPPRPGSPLKLLKHRAQAHSPQSEMITFCFGFPSLVP